MENEKQTNFKKRFGKFHDKYYKHLLLVPLIILILGLAYMGYFYSVNGDFMHRDISLTGGTSFTIQESISSEQLIQDLSSELEEIDTREIYNLITGQQEAIVIQTKSSPDFTKEVLENYLGYELNEKNSSIEFTGSTLSESFFKQLLMAILIAFLFMAIVVFIIFRTFVPSLAIIISAFFDIFMTLLAVNLLGIKMSTAGIVAFLMLIGYSVDTDILLTNRVLKRYGDLNSKFFSAFKTGMTMTLTSAVAVGVALIFAMSFSVVLTQIFTILFLGLMFDLLNTWITNVSILKWYVVKKN
jgi:preprotein translocase subunit SecF